MTQRHPFRKVLALLCCAVILLGVSLPASAAETILDITYVPIVGEGFVADTLNGVDALYNQDGPTIYCVELLVRYYKEVYGIDISCDDSGVSVKNNDNYYFEQTDTPKTGDIMYGAAAARGKDYNHWAIVKSADADTVTCFEQNWGWNGQAGVNRRIPFPNDCYVFYTLKAKTGTPKVINGSDETASTWATDYLAKAVSAGIANLTGFYQEAVSREAFCRMAVNVAASYGFTAEGDTACAQAAALGFVSSASSADAAVSREEAAVILTRLLSRIGTAPKSVGTALTAYTDASSISFWAADAVAGMTSCGLMSGTGKSFLPKNKLTNEQAVILMVRVSENPTPAAVQTETASELQLELAKTASASQPAETAAPEKTTTLSSADAALAASGTASESALHALVEGLELRVLRSFY